jgi:8-oxo-dGTP diphosphatase
MARKKSGFTYEYPRPALTVDVVIVSRTGEPKVLLIRRKHEPFAGCWAIPGGFVDEGETLEEAARRELLEETGVEVDDLEQIGTFGDPGRDPRGWTVAVAHLARVSPSKVAAKAADDAAELDWHPLAKLPPLAFDHAKILEAARRRLPKPRKKRAKR